jgi:HEAT repeat protein
MWSDKEKDAVPALIPLLDDPKTAVRVRALEALGWIGPPAKQAALSKLAILAKTDQDKKVQKAITEDTGKLKIEFGEWQQALAAP